MLTEILSDRATSLSLS